MYCTLSNLHNDKRVCDQNQSALLMSKEENVKPQPRQGRQLCSVTPFSCHSQVLIYCLTCLQVCWINYNGAQGAINHQTGSIRQFKSIRHCELC